MTRRFELAANHEATSWTDITSLIQTIDHFHTFRIGGRANNGESAACGFNLDDDAAAIDFPAHRVVRVVEDAPGYDYVMFWGRIEDDSIGRGNRFEEDARRFDVQLADVNAELRGIASSRFIRPAEEPWQRMRAFLAAYCDGTWRPSTVLDRFTWVGERNFADLMEKKSYIAFEGDEVVSDIAAEHNQLYFVTIDHEVYLDHRDYAGYASAISIRDDVDEDRVTNWNPDIETTNERNSQEVISGGLARYGDNLYVHARRTDLEALGDRWQTVIDVDTTNENFAQNKLESTIDRHKDREETIRCVIYVPADKVDVIKHGQVLTFRAAAAGVLSPRVLRIAELMWEDSGPGLYKATLELSFPRKVGARTSPGSRPPVTHPELPPFQQVCTVVDGTLVNLGAVSNSINPRMDSVPTVGNLAIVAAMLGVSSSSNHSTIPSGWTAASPEIIVDETGHFLGGPYEHARFFYKILEAADIVGLPTPAINFAGMWDTSGEQALFAWEVSGLGATPTVTAVTTTGDGGSPTVGPISVNGFSVVGFWQLSNVLAGAGVTGWTEDTSALGGWDAGGSGPRGWVGHAVGTGSLTAAMTGSTSIAWGGIAVNFSAAEPECNSPSFGQPIGWELAGIGDGTNADFQTNWAPYAADSLEGIIRNPATGQEQPIQLIETDPANGLFSTAFPVPIGWELLVRYQAGQDATETTAGNPAPDPSTGVFQLGNEVVGLLPDDAIGQIGHTGTASDAGHRHPTSALLASAVGVPTYIAPGETFTVPANRQVLFAIDIVNDGDLIVDGDLVMVD